ncbi:MAG: AraC family transcriptional regulator [Verrucomicrobia bacterium]|nr:MAG: AraC family transcriptional regulator [Verrucomicrobiota bacterium]
MIRLPITQQEWERLAVQAEYAPAKLAVLRGVSLRQLERDIKRRFGLEPRKWLDKQRIVAAQKRLLAGQSVKCVAMELGFKQASHFCRQFKLEYNLTPSQFLAAAVNGAATSPPQPSCDTFSPRSGEGQDEGERCDLLAT